MANERARSLRKNATDAEHILWRRLREKKSHGYKFRRQHPIGRYIVDFACLDDGLVVELDGEQHAFGAQAAHDARRDAWLRREGYEVLRFWNEDVYKDCEGVAEKILYHLDARQ